MSKFEPGDLVDFKGIDGWNNPHENAPGWVLSSNSTKTELIWLIKSHTKASFVSTGLLELVTSIFRGEVCSKEET